MAESFAGLSFDALTSSGNLPLVGYKANISIRHIPNSNNNVIDFGGLEAGTLKLAIRLANVAAYLALRAKLGTSGALIYDGATYAAVLSDLTGAVRILSSTSYVMCEASFVL